MVHEEQPGGGLQCNRRVSIGLGARHRPPGPPAPLCTHSSFQSHRPQLPVQPHGPGTCRSPTVPPLTTPLSPCTHRACLPTSHCFPRDPPGEPFLESSAQLSPSSERTCPLPAPGRLSPPTPPPAGLLVLLACPVRSQDWESLLSQTPALGLQ